jgi:hypothetical protein
LAIAVSTDSSLLFVGGSSYPEPFEGNTVAYHALDGSKAWARSFPASENADLLDLAASRDGSRVAVTGGAFDPGSRMYVGITVGYQAVTGTQLWSARDPTRYFRAVGVTHNARVTFLAGFAGGDVWTATAYRSP